MSRSEHLEAIETALMRAHCLSKAIGFMLELDTDESGENGSTYRAAIEEVNDCAHEAVQTAIDLTHELQHALRKGTSE